MGLTKATNRMTSGASYNVLDFGAVGDGATDDTSAIQAAIAASNLDKKSLLIPSGTYLISAPLDLGENAANLFPLTIYGEGKQLKQDTNLGGSILKWTGSSALHMIDATGDITDNLRIPFIMKDLALDGSDVATIGIIMEHNHRFTELESLHISNFVKAGILMGTNWIVTFKNVHLRKNRDGLAMPDAAGVRYNEIVGSQVPNLDLISCNIEQNDDYGIYMPAYRMGVLNVVGGTIEGNAASVTNTAAQIFWGGGNSKMNVFGTYFEWGNSNNQPLVDIDVGGGILNFFGGHLNRKNAVADFKNVSGTAWITTTQINLVNTYHHDTDGDGTLYVDDVDKPFLLLSGVSDSRELYVSGRTNTGFPGINIQNTGDGQTSDFGAGVNFLFTSKTVDEIVLAASIKAQKVDYWSSAASTNKSSELIFTVMKDTVLADEVKIDRDGHLKPITDNTNNLGTAANRWAIVYAGTGTINTSDANDKQQVEILSVAESRVATKVKGQLRKFKFNEAVEAKGDEARIHFGVMAQDLQQAFIDEGLDPSKYGVFCSDTWWIDSEGKTYDEAGDGRTEKTKLGVRYSELFAFIISTL